MRCVCLPAVRVLYMIAKRPKFVSVDIRQLKEEFDTLMNE